MSYEHKLIVTRRSEHKTPTGKTIVYGEQITTFKCSRMPQQFYNLFHDHGTPIDFDLYDRNDEPTRIDCYGEHCKMLDVPIILQALKGIQQRDADFNNYRRIPPLIGLLEGFRLDQWHDSAPGYSESLVIVNYGY